MMSLTPLLNSTYKLVLCVCHYFCFFFFFNDTATTEIYTLSLHDALPISLGSAGHRDGRRAQRSRCRESARSWRDGRDRKSTRLNSSHSQISYAVFCLKKKKKNIIYTQTVKQLCS